MGLLKHKNWHFRARTYLRLKNFTSRVGACSSRLFRGGQFKDLLYVKYLKKVVVSLELLKLFAFYHVNVKKNAYILGVWRLPLDFK